MKALALLALALLVIVAVVALGGGLLGCSRHVVLDPGDVVRSNDPTWNVMREPSADGGAAATRPSL